MKIKCDRTAANLVVMGFIIGFIVGVVTVLSTLDSNEDEEHSKSGEISKKIADEFDSLDAIPSDLLLPSELSRKKTSLTKSKEEKKEEKEEDKGKEVWETIMALGAEKEKEEVRDEVDKMAERLQLNDSQKANLQELLEAKVKSQTEAGMKLFTGKASISDLILSDKDNYSALDYAMKNLLSGDQLTEYEKYAEDREIERIEKKTNEDLGGIRGIAGITQDQIDQARDLFIEINASEKPGPMPTENINRQQFMGFIDQSLDKRVNGVAKFLSDDQVMDYRKQIDGFKKMISTLVPEANE